MKLTRAKAVRFNALLARSGSEAIEEARTAAYQACKILREAGLRLHIPPLPEEKEETAMAKQEQSKVRIRVHRDEQSLQVDVKEHQDAGFEYDEAASVKEMHATGVQCIILRRGKETAKFTIADLKSEPPRYDGRYQEERETADSLDEDELNE